MKHDNFDILGRLVECRKPGTTCLDKIRIDYQGETWILEQGRKVTDEVGAPITLPFKSSNDITIIESGKGVEAVLPNGVNVIWDGIKKVEILVTDQFRNVLDGRYMYSLVTRCIKP